MVDVDSPVMAGPDPAPAAARLLAHRRAQRGRPTPGDAADLAFLSALRETPADAPAARAAGEAAGREVYAKIFVDAPLPRALDLLSAGLAASGHGALVVDDAFHRQAVLRHLAGDAPAASRAFVEGALRGFLSECYNCEASVRALPDGRIEARLGTGRDVNGRGRA